MTFLSVKSPSAAIYISIHRFQAPETWGTRTTQKRGCFGLVIAVQPAVRMTAKPSTHDVFSKAEIELAYRNHGAFTEGLKRDITPIGMHYLLVHYDIPEIDVKDWRLGINGLVSRPLRLTLENIKARPKVTRVVTLECAGNGRANMRPRRQSVPWNNQAFGTAEWTGCSLKDLLQEAGLLSSAVEICALIFGGKIFT
jgi:DMSO/TMAO reductase YedYZ molybdopterin-dependent catalytic subunit